MTFGEPFPLEPSDEPDHVLRAQIPTYVDDATAL
jgi:hypothetical protein